MYLCARAWDRDTGMKASEQLRQILGGQSLDVLIEATRRVMVASHKQESDGAEESDEPEPPKPRKRR